VFFPAGKIVSRYASLLRPHKAQLMLGSTQLKVQLKINFIITCVKKLPGMRYELFFAFHYLYLRAKIFIFN
jgi:hypothetical protein